MKGTNERANLTALASFTKSEKYFSNIAGASRCLYKARENLRPAWEQGWSGALHDRFWPEVLRSLVAGYSIWSIHPYGVYKGLLILGQLKKGFLLIYIAIDISISRKKVKFDNGKLDQEV